MGRLGSNPPIVTVFDLGQEAGNPNMVNELMSGVDVEGVIEYATDHRLPVEQAIDIARETSRGLEFARSRGIVPRDLKPGNVWLTGDGAYDNGNVIISSRCLPTSTRRRHLMAYHCAVGVNI